MGSNLDMVAQDERLCIDRAMQQWEASLKRPDLSERDRVLGAIDAFVRQSLACQLTLRVEIDGLRSIVQTYSEAHEAAVRQGVQMRDRMEEAR